MRSKSFSGFTLTEVMIVIAIIGIMASTASFSWQRYVNNTNLRTAARDVTSDFQSCKTKAVSESRNYQITFTTGTNSSYTISAAATTTHATVSTTKLPTAHGSGLQITSAAFFGSAAANIITFHTRGTSSNGTVIMTNARASIATIKTNVTGKAYVTFSMQ